jgi:hypothetical protein
MLEELIRHHPEYLFAGCISWVIVACWVLTLVQRMITLDVDVLTGTIGIGMTLGLGYMAISPPIPILQPLSIGSLFASGAMIPLLRFAYNRRELRNADVEAVDKAYEGFVLRPNNPAAKIRLARHLYNLGVRGHALVLAEDAITQLPRKYFPDEHRMLDAWRQHPPAQTEFGPIACIECGARNNAGQVHCFKCGARFLLDHVKGRPVSRALGRKLLAAWIVMALALVGIPLSASLKGMAGLAGIAGVTVLAVGALAMAFRPEKELNG